MTNDLETLADDFNVGGRVTALKTTAAISVLNAAYLFGQYASNGTNYEFTKDPVFSIAAPISAAIIIGTHAVLGQIRPWDEFFDHEYIGKSNFFTGAAAGLVDAIFAAVPSIMAPGLGTYAHEYVGHLTHILNL